MKTRRTQTTQTAPLPAERPGKCAHLAAMVGEQVEITVAMASEQNKFAVMGRVQAVDAVGVVLNDAYRVGDRKQKARPVRMVLPLRWCLRCVGGEA